MKYTRWEHQVGKKKACDHYNTHRVRNSSSKPTYPLCKSELHHHMHREKKQACVWSMLHSSQKQSKTSFKGNLPTEYELITQSNCSMLGKKQGMGSLLHIRRSQKKSSIVRYIHAKATYQLSTSELQRSAASWERRKAMWSH